MKELYVGIDVSNMRLDVCFLDCELRALRPRARYDNTPEGWTALRAAAVSTATLLGPDARIVCGMESTSNMHKRLEEALRKERRRPVEVHVLNPMAIKHFRKVVLRDSKNDRMDAELIGAFMVRMKPKPRPLPPEGSEDLRTATRSRRTLVESQTQAKNELHRFLRQYFPGYRQCLGRAISNRLLVVLSEHPSPGEILAQSQDDLASLRNGARGRVGEKFAQTLQALAAQAPQREVPRAICLLIEQTARHLLGLKRRLLELDKAIEELADEVFPEQMELLCSIPGIGKVSAASILAEVGDIRRFPSKDKLVGYSGLYPVVWESGEGEGKKRRFKMTFKGNRMLKTTLLVASAAARQFNPTIATFYERLRRRHKSTKAAGGAIARKLAEVVFAVLQSGEPWSAEVARRGIEKGEAMAEATPA
jgi:transposase